MPQTNLSISPTAPACMWNATFFLVQFSSFNRYEGMGETFMNFLSKSFNAENI